MKLVIQIPCLNEADTLPLVFERMPRQIDGVDSIDYLLIDDGSSDRTVDVALSLGVRHFVRHTRTMGLGQSFHDGILMALQMGADVVVNTDGDNQYPSDRIPDLIRPIVEGAADIVIADRQTGSIAHFSPAKKRLQRIGSRVVNLAADTDVPDAASGFRAYSRDTLIRLNPVTKFSYCMETIIQAGNKHLQIASISITTNPKTRDSRLFKSTREHVMKSAAAILRAYMMYKPVTFFATLGGVFFVASLIPFVRFLVLLWFTNGDNGPARHLQSLVFGGVLMICAVIIFALGVIAELIRINRILIEDTLEQHKRDRYDVQGARPLVNLSSIEDKRIQLRSGDRDLHGRVEASTLDS